MSQNEATYDEPKASTRAYRPWKMPAYIDIEIGKHIDDHWTFSTKIIKDEQKANNQ